MTLKRTAIVAGVGVLALLTTSAALCRFAVDCHLRTLPLLDRFAHEPPVLEGLHERGTGQTALPAGFEQEVVASGLNLPTSFTELPDGRFLIAEKDGLVRAVAGGRVLARPFLDLRDVVEATALRGLVAIETTPDFDRTGLVYLLYSRRSGARGHTIRLSRVTARGGQAATAEEVVLGAVNARACAGPRPPDECIVLDGDHLGGAIEFLADGTMLVSLGDGGGEEQGVRENAFRAQDLDSLSGKVLRVTREGEGVRSNPFWNGNPRSNRSRIFAYGFRNPFRMAVHPETTTPYVADVGWDGWDEINAVVPGENYGWPCYEGGGRTTGYRETPRCTRLYARGAREGRPLLSYPAASATGGAFYTGDRYPQRYRGAYVYGDWAQSWLRYLPATARTAGGSTTPVDFASQAGGPVQIKMGSDGNLLYLALNAGELRKIVYAGG